MRKNGRSRDKRTLLFRPLEAGLHDAAVHSQGRTVGGRRQRAADVHHEIRDLLRGREPLQQRAWAGLREEFVLESFEWLSAAQLCDELADARGPRGAWQDRVDGHVRTDAELREAA